jgi:drug/metabolite transporter (DMT)-like permease
MNRAAVLYALVSAALFGLSTPAAKVLLGAIDPLILAGVLYCGAGLGVAILRRAAPKLSGHAHAQTALSRADWPWLAGAIVCGGILGPILLMVGLARTEAASASLLLTLEGALTALMAWSLFHEPFDRRIVLGMACLLAGALVLSWSGAPTLAMAFGPLAIVGACFAWGLDNNLTRKVSLADPLQIVEWKGLAAGPVNILLGLWAGGALPSPTATLIAAAVGFVGYGLSLALYIVALRDLGAARTSAYFSTAPFIGAVAAVIALGEPATFQLATAGLLMAWGVWLHLSERHAHAHSHAPMAHAHSHTHDPHHRHDHETEGNEPHAHWHQHGRFTHAHPHMPDMHHGHRH